jgi:GNAT superfamily N-acetyltransferase
MLSRDEIADLADDNLATHFGYVQARVPGMRVWQRDLVAVDCGMPCDTFNAVCRARLRGEDVSARVQDVVRWFAERRHPFSWWHGPADRPADLADHLTRAGLEPAESELAMAVRLQDVPAPAPSTRWTIVRADTSVRILDFARINAANRNPPDQAVVDFYAAATPLLVQPESPLQLFVAYWDDEPVATVEVTRTPGVLGVYNVSTIAAYRRRGIASDLIKFALRATAQADSAVAILQAAPNAASVYERLGFTSYGRITEFKPRGL